MQTNTNNAATQQLTASDPKKQVIEALTVFELALAECALLAREGDRVEREQLARCLVEMRIGVEALQTIVQRDWVSEFAMRLCPTPVPTRI